MGGLQNVEYYEQTEYTFEARAANEAILYLYWTRDLASYAVLISSGSSAIITGGTFAEGRYGTIGYQGGKLDLTGYLTTAVEGTTPLTDISVYSNVTVGVSNETLALPADYCFYNGEERAVTVLATDTKHTVGEEPATKYTITYVANGGSVTMVEGSSYGGDYILPECAFTAPEGKMFKAWQVGGTEYLLGEIITVDANTAVTVVWRDYVTQLILELTDEYIDGWNGAAITVEKDDEEIGTATIPDGETTAPGIHLLLDEGESMTMNAPSSSR